MRPLYAPRKQETPLADGRLDALALGVLRLFTLYYICPNPVLKGCMYEYIINSITTELAQPSPLFYV